MPVIKETVSTGFSVVVAGAIGVKALLEFFHLFLKFLDFLKFVFPFGLQFRLKCCNLVCKGLQLGFNIKNDSILVLDQVISFLNLNTVTVELSAQGGLLFFQGGELFFE